MKRFEGKFGLVTGSSSGIGQAIAIELAKQGATVAIHYNSNEEGAKETRKKTGQDVPVIGCNISDVEDVKDMFSQLDSAFPTLDFLVNNGGMEADDENLEDLDPADWDKVISVNLNGTFYCTAEAVRRMRKQGSGVIMHLTSVHEKIPWAKQCAYSATKAGVAMMSQSLALELADSGVRTFCLAPGAIKTDINKDSWSDPEKKKDLLEKIPMNRLGTPEEIARLTALLLSDDASYVTGTSLFADGGMVAYPSFATGG